MKDASDLILFIVLNPVQVLRNNNTVVCDALKLAAFRFLHFSDKEVLTSLERL